MSQLYLWTHLSVIVPYHTPDLIMAQSTWASQHWPKGWLCPFYTVQLRHVLYLYHMDWLFECMQGGGQKNPEAKLIRFNFTCAMLSSKAGWWAHLWTCIPSYICISSPTLSLPSPSAPISLLGTHKLVKHGPMSFMLGADWGDTDHIMVILFNLAEFETPINIDVDLILM